MVVRKRVQLRGCRVAQSPFAILAGLLPGKRRKRTVRIRDKATTWQGSSRYVPAVVTLWQTPSERATCWKRSLHTSHILSWCSRDAAVARRELRRVIRRDGSNVSQSAPSTRPDILDTTRTSMNSSVIVIGAGPGGLAAAIVLAGSGLKVKVLERRPTVGGRTSAIEEGGFKFDLGPTFFLYPRVLEQIFADAGASLRDEVEMVRLDPQYRIIFGEGGQLDATSDIAAMERQIAKIFPGDAAGFRRFLDENRAKLRRMEPCLENPFLGWRDLFAARLMAMLPMLRPHQSIDSYLKRFFRDGRIRLAFSFQSKYLGMSPFRCPSLFSILSFIEYEYGVFHPIGGCSAVTAAMARVAERLGVEICLGQQVEEVLFDGRRAVGVRTAVGCGEGCGDRDQRRLCAGDVTAGAGSIEASLDRSQDRAKEVLVLDVHDVPRAWREPSSFRITVFTSPRTTRATSTKSKIVTSSRATLHSMCKTPA